MILNELNRKVKIDYPSRWVYKIIGLSCSELREAVAGLLQDCPYTISLSNSSATGKYHCMNVEMIVDCEEKRIAVYEALRSHPAVRIVL